MISLDLGVVNLCEPIWALSTRQWALATGLKQSDPEPSRPLSPAIFADQPTCFHVSRLPFPGSPYVATCFLISSTGAYDSHFFAANANSFPRPTRPLLEAKGDSTYLKHVDTYEEVFS